MKPRVRFSLDLRMQKLAWAVVFAMTFSFTALAGGKAGAKKPGGKPAASSGPSERKAPSVNVNRPPEQASAQEAPAGAPPPTRGPTRIDFDDRLIQGQT